MKNRSQILKSIASEISDPSKDLERIDREIQVEYEYLSNDIYFNLRIAKFYETLFKNLRKDKTVYDVSVEQIKFSIGFFETQANTKDGMPSFSPIDKRIAKITNLLQQRDQKILDIPTPIEEFDF